MRSVWQSLAWKEWHEHKWKLAALTGVLCGVTGVALLALLREDFNSLDGFIPALLMGMIPLTLFIGMGEAASENAGRTMPFLQSLPVPMWKAAAWKLVFGAITCLVPVLLTLLVASVWYFFSQMWGKNPQSALWHGEFGLREFAGFESPLLAWIVAVLAMVGSLVASLLIWTAAIGVNRKSEVAAGAVALLGIVGWWVAIFVVGRLVGPLDSPEQLGHRFLALAVAASPCGLSLLMAEVQLRWLSLWIAFSVTIAMHLMLVAWYLKRFGRTASVSAYSPQAVIQDSTRAEWLGMPRRSPFTAILWKQFRESGPIALVGLAAILFFVVVTLLASAGDGVHVSSDELARLILGLTGNIGFLVVLIVGIGVFDRDLTPKLHTFWRSRPINPDLWFWTKYLTGVAVLAVVLLIPAFIAGYLSPSRFSNPPEQPSPFTVLTMVVSVFTAVYALSVATICLVRMTIYAAILSAGTVAIGTGVLWFLMDNMEMDLFGLIATTIITALTTAVLATLVGWWAVRRNIGWKK